MEYASVKHYHCSNPMAYLHCRFLERFVSMHMFSLDMRFQGGEYIHDYHKCIKHYPDN